MISDQPCNGGDPQECGQTVSLSVIIGVSVSAAVVVSVSLILVHRLYFRRESPASVCDPATADHLLPVVTTANRPDVFFLHFPDTEEMGLVNRLLDQWMVGMGHRVVDLADDTVQEVMAREP